MLIIVRIILFILAFLIIVSGGFYYLVLISSEPNIYLFHFIGISSLLFVIIAATRMYLQPEYQKLSNVIILIFFLMPPLFYLTDNSPRIIFKITPENPKSINEVKVLIEASDDRCLRGGYVLETTGLFTMTASDIRAFSWFPRLYCQTKTYKRTIDFTNWPHGSFKKEDLDKLNEIAIKLTLEDAVGHKTTGEMKFAIPK